MIRISISNCQESAECVEFISASTAAGLYESSDPRDRLFCFLVRRMLTAEPAIFVEFQFIRRRALILGCRVISAFALGAR
jgi:hypothetical protein